MEQKLTTWEENKAAWQPGPQSAPLPTFRQGLEPAMGPVTTLRQEETMSHPIGLNEIHEAQQTLQKYKSGKASLEMRIIENEQWYRLRHWECLRREKQPNQVEPNSGWLFNAIANKHADAMDNFPCPNVLPREKDDEAEAKILSSILPVILEQNNFEDIYDRVTDYKLKNGTGMYAVTWDAGKLNGLGDISIKYVDLLNLFWENGITDIQDSRNVFFVHLEDRDLLSTMHPDAKDKLGSADGIVKEYVHDDTVDTTNKAVVVDWYYKKPVSGKLVLHFCQFTGNAILFASENMEAYRERGIYDHGLYPFIPDPLFRMADSFVGFGYIDIAKSAQEYIDRGNQAIMQNLLANIRPRHFIRTDGSVSEEEYADQTKDFVHVEGDLNNSVMPIQGKTLNGIYVSVLNNKVDELKEVTGNRDISNGGTTSGVTAASAIAAMQEAGSKLSRDSNKASFRAYRLLCLMVIELIRQFYDMPRCFRVMGDAGTYEFVSYSNAKLKVQKLTQAMGVDLGSRKPLFDLNITAEKQSPYTKLAQNELALQFYGAGFFNPANANSALACIEMMDFDGKDKIKGIIQANGAAYFSAVGGAGMPVGGNPPGNVPDDTGIGESSVTKNARQRVAESTAPR